ncbi:SapB/AmfS family lanthipeptide [Streptomyces ochraceiscleroticus]|uniref:SapB/AmfS family lanthipeptide n=1 Tax=Streptomyces ochraceiscleroticus TaxID=47761 RepID=A0ABW1MFT2_9ACTN|nr:SapB/AmfS family lanthipeptide [Streptomyces ochraceiscleroticus]
MALLDLQMLEAPEDGGGEDSILSLGCDSTLSLLLC